MANDNLLEAITGLLQGAASVYVPFQQELLRSRIRQGEAESQLQRDIRLKQATLPLEEASKRRMAQFQTGENVREEQLLSPLRIGEKTAEYRAEHPTIGGMKELPPEFKGQGFGELTPEEATKVLTVREKEKEKKEKLGKVPESVTSAFRELEQAFADTETLEQLYHESAKGPGGAAVHYLRNLPIIGGSIGTKTGEYENLVGKTALNIQRAQTKASRSGGGKFGAEQEKLSFPVTASGENPAIGADKFNKAKRSLLTSWSLMVRQYPSLKELSQISDQKAADIMKSSGSVPVKSGAPNMFDDPEKQSRYEEWKRLRGR